MRKAAESITQVSLAYSRSKEVFSPDRVIAGSRSIAELTAMEIFVYTTPLDSKTPCTRDISLSYFIILPNCFFTEYLVGRGLLPIAIASECKVGCIRFSW